MAKQEGIPMSYMQVESLFPVGDWFDYEDHTTAQIFGGVRIPSAIERVNGLSKLAQEYAVILQDVEIGNLPPVILYACLENFMAIPEIQRFVTLLDGNATDREIATHLVSELNTQYVFTRDLTYIQRRENDRGSFVVYENTLGFTTNDNGKKIMSDHWNPKPGEFSGGKSPEEQMDEPEVAATPRQYALANILTR